MFTPTLPLILLQVSSNLFWILAQAASAVPVIIILCLLIARRSNVRLALSGCYPLAKIAGYLALCAAIAIGGELMVLLTELSKIGQKWQLPSIFNPALGNYTLSTLIWILGGIMSLILAKVIKQKANFLTLKSLTLAKSASIFGLALITLIVFFVGYGALSFPFAGLPSGMSASDALLAVAGQAKHQHFISLVPASLIFLSLTNKILGQKDLSIDDCFLAKRFLAGVGLACGLPTALSTWGTVLGYLLRQDVPFQIWVQLARNSCLTLTLIGLSIIAIGKIRSYQNILVLLAALFFILSAILPAIFLLQRYF